jgi:hypothetical protein
MRAPDLNDGTLKAFLILILLGANIALAVFLPKPPASSERPDFARTSPAQTYVARP